MPNREFASRQSLWIGFSIAPVSVPLTYVLWVLLLFTDTTPKQEATLAGFIEVTLVLVLLSYVVSLVTGMPLILVLRRFGKLSFWYVTLLAVPIGAITLAACLFLLLALGATVKGNMWREMLLFSGVGGALGFTVATIFCLLAGIAAPSSGRGRPRRAA